jgi:hypothetical protein
MVAADEKDPYRLPARKTERIALQYPRPDVSVAVDDNGLVLTPTGTNIPGGNPSEVYISTEGNTQTPTQTGNNDIITPDPSSPTSQMT